MELRDLKAFVTLGEVLHFGQAAVRQHVTQSALSKQIRRLEEELGGELFERNASSTRLTVLGRALYQDASAVVAASEQLGRTARDVLAGNSGTLRIGFGVATKILVPAAIARFRTERPQVTIELNDLSTHHQLLALSEGKLDLGFCRLPAPKGWHCLPVVRAHFVAVLPASYAGVRELADLVDKPLAILRRDKAPSFYDHLMNYLAQSGLRFRDIQYVNDFAAGVATAAADIAWTLVPSSTTIEHPDVLTLPLHDTEASWIIGLIRPPHSKGPLIDAFWQIVADLSEPAPTLQAGPSPEQP
ncbi:LysR family transcriptional regulator [Aeromonas hydrophila]|uniref:LysR substrate-binding domain-containing protein n=2 Tax=Gammaproteobacteria TaxID=1236 RepID=A0AAX3PE50_AERHY|nr:MULTISPECIES: LysR family transcriptional regulator [Aeromonas]GKQ63244.1 LysR family transcriptional regulator [Aeromonas caviae]HDT5863614.1 LysR family transcriptional regulator [Aeromonas hydrophila subsp. hydrophila]MCO4115972.1 LysR family transcriptional regulator [Aeromonas hydrophila]MCV9383658.1 LysR substrate-binding domain-containing protein [Aeromonas hydrophila]MDD9223911.1 LysR substrate-binding domain-containing protein [Aeromonas hydrophila]